MEIIIIDSDDEQDGLTEVERLRLENAELKRELSLAKRARSESKPAPAMEADILELENGKGKQREQRGSRGRRGASNLSSRVKEELG